MMNGVIHQTKHMLSFYSISFLHITDKNFMFLIKTNLDAYNREIHHL